MESIAVLFLEDSEMDVEIVRQKMADDFVCPVRMDSAASEEQYRNLLEENNYDLILADYTMPGYSAPEALRLRQSVCPDVPFICVSGTVGEDLAVELLKQGATDYVLKDRLGRLSFAVLRALEGVRNGKEKHRAEDEARKRAETEARLKVMTEFFTNVSHELKTPLSLILMQLDMMRMHLGNEKRMQELLANATLNSYRLTRLVNNLLDITKMDAGFLNLNLRNRDIVQVLRHICESVCDYARARKITLKFNAGADTLWMDIDGDKIERAVLNLLSNAIKHTGEGGSIAVELRDSRGVATVTVTDTGEGIPADKLGSIFNRFVQVDNKMKAQTEGSGIGLALVKSMVELHGGRVWAESEAGKGSTFTIELPVQNAGALNRPVVVEGFDLYKKVQMELSDLYIRLDK